MKNKDKTCFERRMELLTFVMKNQGRTTIEIAKRFSISRTTLHKDLIFLGMYAPIYTKGGNRGGVFILDNYKQDLFMYLSKEEEALLYEMLEIVKDTRKHQLINRIISRYAMPTVGK